MADNKVYFYAVLILKLWDGLIVQFHSVLVFAMGQIGKIVKLCEFQ